MVGSLFVILVAASLLPATDLLVSKDSLKVYNNPVSSFADGIEIVNVVPVATHLDSAFIAIDEMDTTGSGQYGLDGRFSVRWRERMNPALYLYWKLEMETGGRYRLVRWGERDLGTAPLDFSGPGETLGVAFLEIGTCLGCSGVPTWYPPYIKGTLEFFFSNGQTVSIRLYSEDRRTNPASGESCSDYACDSVNVRKILDCNGLESVPVSEVTAVANGRIASLTLSYHPGVATSLPKPCTVLPPEIGNLTGLTSIYFGGNVFESISERIGRCINLKTLTANNNGITVLPDSIVQCRLLQYITLENNRLTRLPDSIGRLKSIKELDVTRNLLTSLPGSMVEIDSMRCVFIAGNKICTLSDTVVAWLGSIKRKMYCARFDPAWPDSQECSVALAGRANNRGLPAPAIIRVFQEEGLLTVETELPDRSAVIVELSDVAGRLVRQAAVSGAIIRLSTRDLARGVYYVALVSHGRIISVGRFLSIGK